MASKVSGVQRRLLSLKSVVPNAHQKMGGATLLAAIPAGLASLVIIDPQYRAVLDKLSYGNEGARQKGRAALPSQSDQDITFFIEEIERILRPSGHVALWMDKFSLASGHYHRWLRRTPTLQIVDLIHWNKLGFGMGKRTRGVSEYLVILQKPPIRAKDVWTDHGIRDSWSESSDKSIHPHAKPSALTERLIRAVTSRGDLVVDPCAGGYGVLEACRVSGREFLGCDLMEAPVA